MVGSFEEFTAPIKVLYYGLGLPVFLGMPHTYFRRIQDVDRTRFHDGVNAMRWKIFVRSLLKEWSDSNLLVSVVLLNRGITTHAHGWSGYSVDIVRRPMTCEKGFS